MYLLFHIVFWVNFFLFFFFLFNGYAEYYSFLVFVSELNALNIYR